MIHGTVEAAPPSLSALDLMEKARYILDRRKARVRYFSDQIFADPAWDILLYLYVGLRSGRRISVSAACTAAAVPTSTALRWVRLLVEKGLALKVPDPTDARRNFLEMRPRAIEALEAFLANC